ncbi:MAG: hypothetical protein K2Z80_21115 [Xanthobacteraceae bacterium]|nr:hypothetical protein [Xanthobacteraceae bacterium]
MQELELTWQRTLSIWWLILWRSLLGSVAIGFVVGAAIGIFRLATGITQVPQLAPALGTIVGLVWSFFVVRMVLRKRYKGFRIALLPAAAPGDFANAASSTRIEPRF